MSQSYKGLTIPAYADAADIPLSFKDFVDSGAIPRFANAAARDAAIATPVAGMLAFMIDTGDIVRYLGASWTVPFLKASGGTLTGNLDAVNAFRLINLPSPTAAGDAVSKGWVEAGFDIIGHTHATGAHVHAAADTTSGAFADARIPSLNASKVTAGTFVDARIPTLNASKITAGTFVDARIPNLAATKITSGTFAVARIPTGTSSSTVSLGNHEHGRIAPHTGSPAQITVTTGAAAGGGDGDIHFKV